MLGLARPSDLLMRDDLDGSEAAAYDELAAAYAEIGAKWTVWLHEDDAQSAALSFPTGWSEAHPRTQHLLDEEVALWARSGTLALALRP